MAPRLDVSLDQRGEAAIVKLAGELDRLTAPELTAVLERATERASRFVMDLRDVSFMDVGGLQVILDAQAAALRAGHDLDLIAGPAAVQRVKRAGADRVISPYEASGSEMARLALQPQVSGVLDVAPEYRMEEIEVTPGCAGAGQALGDIRGGSIIVALRGEDGSVQPQPSGDIVLRVGDVLLAMGPRSTMERLERVFAPADAAAE